MGKRFLVLTWLSVWAATSCGSPASDGTTGTTSSTGGAAAASGIAEPPTCEGALKDPFFGGAGRVALSISEGATIACSVDFASNDEALRQLGVVHACPPQASLTVILSVDPATRSWRFDAEATREVDNGECAHAGAG